MPMLAGAPTPSLSRVGGWVVEIRHRRCGASRGCRHGVHCFCGLLCLAWRVAARHATRK